ncbi:33395_t:CDS:2, partial [Racocetra persica]
RRARESTKTSSYLWQHLQTQMKNCTCEVSQKTRTDFEWTKCESCGKHLDAARKKRRKEKSSTATAEWEGWIKPLKIDFTTPTP